MKRVAERIMYQRTKESLDLYREGKNFSKLFF